MKQPLIYHEAPVLGIDIGSHTVKVVQLSGHRKGAAVVAYGHAGFSPDAIVEGIISDPEPIAEAIKQVLKSPSGGKFTAKRAVLSVPVSKVFTRTLQLPPNMSPEELQQAVTYEAEQYVPVPNADLYIDYEIIEGPSQLPAAKQPAKTSSKTPADEPDSEAKDDGPHTEILMVAAPRAIIDSHVKLFDYLDLEAEAIETGLTAITRAMIAATRPEQVALVVDFGTKSADVAIYEQALRLTGSFGVGGDSLTQTLVKQLGITTEQANEIKYKFGLKDSGLKAKILEALQPQLATVSREINKILKYYQDRGESKTKIEMMILTGGTSAMPGLVDYLYKELGVPIIIGDPWVGLNTKHVGAVDKLESPMYTTAIGLAGRELAV